jgi:3-methyladenine DNA glycosylase AlkD
MTAQAILDELKPLGSENYKRVLLNHGAKEPCFGVKIEELKTIQKRVKTNYQLALDLYDTGVYDAMYLAGLIADDARMTRKDLQRWVEKACDPLIGSTIPWVTAGSRHGWAVALEWIDSAEELIAAAGWAALGSLVAIKPDDQLDGEHLKKLLDRVHKTIHRSPNAVRYAMNSFVIAVGAYVQSLTRVAIDTAERTGPVKVDMGDTACQVPFAPDYIRKIEQRGAIGKKRKTVKC